MKRFLLFLLFSLFISNSGFAQNTGITYQAVMYNSDGAELHGEDNPYAQFIEDSIAILRRFIPLIPAKYHFEITGHPPILMQQRFNPFIRRTDVMIPPGHPLDRRVIAAVALLSSAIEGRQG